MLFDLYSLLMFQQRFDVGTMITCFELDVMNLAFAQQKHITRLAMCVVLQYLYIAIALSI